MIQRRSMLLRGYEISDHKTILDVKSLYYVDLEKIDEKKDTEEEIKRKERENEQRRLVQRSIQSDLDTLPEALKRTKVDLAKYLVDLKAAKVAQEMDFDKLESVVFVL